MLKQDVGITEQQTYRETREGDPGGWVGTVLPPLATSTE